MTIGQRTIGHRQLVDSSIVANNHTVETEIATQDIIEYGTVSHTGQFITLHGMIARHEGTTASHTNHRLVRQQDFFHQLFLVGIATTTIAEVVFRTGTDTFTQVALL